MLRFHTPGASLAEVEWDIPIPVLDQEDLNAQGIDTSQLVQGAQKVDALGSCVPNASTASLAQRTVAAGRELPSGLSADDAVADERFAIVLYNEIGQVVGVQAEAWPPNDDGSTGEAAGQTLVKLGLISSYTAPHGTLGALSALQLGTVVQGTPFFNDWMEADSQGFVDGDGSLDALKAAMDSGLAGGHETCLRGIPQLAQTDKGVELDKTVVKVRNSWSAQFALDGDFLLHASTLDHLGRYVDYKQFVI